MPWRYYRWRKPWYRRRRYTWRRRPRQTFRRRFWRRRHRVRYQKRKLKKITIRQYQPSSIKKLKVKGIHPLFLANKDRLSNNLTQWLYSTTPTHFPGGGGMSLTQFTLNGLFELHSKLSNWWTKSNCTLPLVRYQGCTIKLYKTENFDYVFRYNTCPPMKSCNLLYMCTQPSMMMMNKNNYICTMHEINKI